MDAAAARAASLRLASPLMPAIVCAELPE